MKRYHLGVEYNPKTSSYQTIEIECNESEWVKCGDVQAKIAELEAEVSLHTGIQNNFNQLRADAIREMVNSSKQFTHYPSSIKISTILEYADNLEKSDG